MKLALRNVYPSISDCQKRKKRRNFNCNFILCVWNQTHGILATISVIVCIQSSLRYPSIHIACSARSIISEISQFSVSEQDTDTDQNRPLGVRTNTDTDQNRSFGIQTNTGTDPLVKHCGYTFVNI